MCLYGSVATGFVLGALYSGIFAQLVYTIALPGVWLDFCLQ